MQLVFFVRDNTLLDSIFSLAQGKLGEKVVVWHGQNLSDIVGTFPGILFFHYDDPEFNFSEFKAAVLEADLKENGTLIVLMSQELSVKEFKKLQIENKFIDGFLRMPIKLKDIETFVEDYKLVLNEVGEGMEGAKKKNLEDPVNAKIQQRFDLVFSDPASKKSANEKQSTVFNDGEDIQFDDVNLHGDTSMSESAKKNPGQDAPVVLDFDMSGELEFDGAEALAAHTPPPNPPSAPSATKLSVVPDDDSGLEFNLDFGDDSSEIPAPPVEAAHTTPVHDANKTTSGADFEFDFAEESEDAPVEMLGKSEQPAPAVVEEGDDDLNALFEADLETANAHVQEMPEDGTQKTILFDPSQISDFGEKESFSVPEKTGSHSSSDLMTTDEARANIESTIKDIIRPKAMESTQEIDITAMGDDELDFSAPVAKPSKTLSQDSATGEFDLSSMEFADKDPEPVKAPVATPVKETYVSAPEPTQSYSERAHTSFVSDEDSNRLHATIRQLREEREELLTQIKTFKGDARELEQDNLTLKAALDESKIEISILRKRHMVEMEDFKYRLSLNEEKKALAEERARAAESKREKLEQRVRIDFNQVKQREKELETKLEMLTIDVDSQVQSRDQKILELRRKIDALEFNMENVSIKEQKSQDDKRKLEDKLNKIMKTLRHSIKNLEDDIDQATDDSQDDKESADPRSKA